MQSQSEEQICTFAMTVLKQKAVVSISDSTVQAQMCASVFAMLRDELLSLYAFTFSVSRKHLARVNVPPVNQYLYAHAIPADCLQPLELRGALAPYITPSGAPIPDGYGQFAYGECGYGTWPNEDVWDSDIAFVWVVEGENVLSNAVHLYLKYVSQVTQTGLFSPLFSMALAYRIASTLAYSMTGKSDYAEALMKMSDVYALRAQNKDAQIGTEEHFPKSDSWVRSRSGGGVFFGRYGWGQGPTE